MAGRGCHGNRPDRGGSDGTLASHDTAAEGGGTLGNGEASGLGQDGGGGLHDQGLGTPSACRPTVSVGVVVQPLLGRIRWKVCEQSPGVVPVQVE